MIARKTKDEIEILRVAGGMLIEVLGIVANSVIPGVSGAQLNYLAEKEIRKVFLAVFI